MYLKIESVAKWSVCAIEGRRDAQTGVFGELFVDAGIGIGGKPKSKLRGHDIQRPD